MRILFELSKEHPTLPVAEIRACLRAEHISTEELYHNNTIYITESDSTDTIDWTALVKRLALSYSINELLGRTPEVCVESLQADSSFRVSGGTQNLRACLGTLLTQKTGASINLDHPDISIAVFQNGYTKPYFCRVRGVVDRHAFEQRRPSVRPYATPTTLHPRLARALVNLAEVKKGDVVLDPFCGTGGILIEAGLLGIKVRGIDIKHEVMNGCERNLAWCHIKPDELLTADMREVALKSSHAVVTDFPYGRAAHLSDKREILYQEALKCIAACTPKAVIGLPSLSYRNLVAQYFNIVEIHCVRVHKSLIRFFYVLRS